MTFVDPSGLQKCWDIRGTVPYFDPSDNRDSRGNPIGGAVGSRQVILGRICTKDNPGRENQGRQRGQGSRGKPKQIQQLTPCQAKFVKDQLDARAMPSAHIDSVEFVSGLDERANWITRTAFEGGATAVTQGSTVYVQPSRFSEVANLRSEVGFEELYHTSQFANDPDFYGTYGTLSIGGWFLGDSYDNNVYEAFAKGAAKKMFEASVSDMCP